jgi:hypothetical protein
MNWLQSIKHSYSLHVFMQRAKRVHFPHSFLNMEKCNSIGFIINIDQFTADDLVYFTKYITHLEDRGKQVAVVELSYKRKSLPMFKDSVLSIFINPAQMNWLDFPSVKRLQELNAIGLEILVNLDTTEKMTSRFICGLSSAKTRVGLHESGQETFYELLLQLPTETRLPKILETFEFYSKMLEK